MGGRLFIPLLLLLLPSDAAGPPEKATPPPPPSVYSLLDLNRCMNCHLPPTFKASFLHDCGNEKLPNCRRPLSAPYKGQNHNSTCARLICPDNFDLFVNTASMVREDDTIVEYAMRRPTVVCNKYSDIEYRFMIRDGGGYLRPVTDAQCRRNNYPRHSCVSDGFVKQECTKGARCKPIRYLSDFGGNKCEPPYQLHMRFDKRVEWELMSKLTCDRDRGWWRIHFPNGTWMHTRYGTIATCVAITFPADPSTRVTPVIVKMLLGICLLFCTLLVSFNSYMCRSVVIWEGSDWHRSIAAAETERNMRKAEHNADFRARYERRDTRDLRQDDLVKFLRQHRWNDVAKDGICMDLRQFDVMRESDHQEHVNDMMPWAMLDDYDYNLMLEESQA